MATGNIFHTPNITFDSQETTSAGHATHVVRQGEVVMAFASAGNASMWVATAMYRRLGDEVSFTVVPNNTGYCSFRISGDTLVCDTTYSARVVFVTFAS